VKLAAIAVALLCACDRDHPVNSCDDDLGGVWRTEAGERWMILDGGQPLEVYPLFADVPPSSLEVAPRVIDLSRQDGKLAGVVRRRYLRGSDACDATAPVHVTSCASGTIELVLADPVAPVGFTPCAWASQSSSRRERWRAE